MQRCKLLLAGLTALLLIPLLSCTNGGSIMDKTIYLDAIGFNYTKYEVWDLYLNKHWIGGAGSGRGVVAGVPIEMGDQKITWRLGAPEGVKVSKETFHNVNQIMLKPDDIPKGAKYIGVHIYADNTAEITFSSDTYPDPTERGVEYWQQTGKYKGVL